jgi:hypothetical protein
MRPLLEAIESKVCELVDLLNHPAGEYAPRARRILNELVDMVIRWLDAREREENEPTEPRMRLWSAPKPPAVPRKRQETMEIDLKDVIFEEYERRRDR